MSCNYFAREFSRFGLLQIKISDNNLWGHNPFWIFNRIVFLNVKKLNIGLHSVLCTVNSLVNRLLMHTRTHWRTWVNVELTPPELGQLKSWRKQPPIFFQKKWGSVFFNFLIQALLRPQIAIQQRANISPVIFSWFWTLKIKKIEKNYMVITLSDFLTILAIKIFEIFYFG